MKSFNSQEANKLEAITLAESALTAGRIQPWTRWLDEASGRGAPFSLLLGGTDYEALAPKFGIPASVADLFEVTFGFFARTRLEGQALERYIDPDAQRSFVSFVQAIPVGVDLQKVPSAFAVELLNSLSTPGLLLEPLSAEVRLAAEKLTSLYERYLRDDVAPKSEWAEVRRGAVCLTNKSKTGSDARVAAFIETCAWAPTAELSEVGNAVMPFISRGGTQAYESTQTAEERSATQMLDQRLDEMTKQLGRYPTREEIDPLPEMVRVNELLPMRRQLELGNVMTDANSRYAAILLDILNKTVARQA